jgi:hypothetical protein
MSDRAVAPIGLAQSLRRYPLTKETEISIAPKLDIEAATRPPRPTTNVVGPIPSRASTPLSECYRYATTVVRPCERFCTSMALSLSDQKLPTVPSEVLSPSAFSQPRGATELQRVPNTLVPLRPQGFAPSRRFAPHAISRACFIPIPLLGFSLRGFAPRAVPVRLLRRRVPPDFESSPALRATPRPSRD